MSIDTKKLVFIDETWAKTNMTPLYGWAPKGKRVSDDVPHGHWKTTIFLAALRHDGLTAPMVVDGAINGELFLERIKICSGVIVHTNSMKTREISHCFAPDQCLIRSR